MIMTLQEKQEYDIPEIKKSYISKLGTTYGMDYMIGNTQFLGKGLGSKTLDAFIDYFREQIDPQADTFFIDPNANNPKARHVYEKASFAYVADFIMGSGCSGAGQKHYFLVKKITLDNKGSKNFNTHEPKGLMKILVITDIHKDYTAARSAGAC